MKIIYVCSPFRGDTEGNLKKVKEYCRDVVYQGNCPIAPHLHFPLFLDDNDDYERYLGCDCGLRLLEICNELWVYGVPTGGMRWEIKRARQLCKEIYYHDENGKKIPFYEAEERYREENG